MLPRRREKNALALVPMVHSSPEFAAQVMQEQEHFEPLVYEASPIEQARAVYSERRFEVHRPILAGDRVFGEIRVGVSTLLVRDEISEGLLRAAQTAIAALAISTIVATLLSQWMLRPIHVIQSGLSRLGRGELDVTLDLKEQEFRDLGSSFEAVSAQLSALGRGGAAVDSATAEARPGAPTDLESVMDNLEDAVALFSPRGELIFCNKAMSTLQLRALDSLPRDHPVKQIVERTLAGRKPQGPVSISGLDPADTAERLLVTHAIEISVDGPDRPVGQGGNPHCRDVIEETVPEPVNPRPGAQGPPRDAPLPGSPSGRDGPEPRRECNPRSRGDRR